ncbi:MAG: type II secretion system protein GspL [Legionella sp.]|nr:type II secretion system protein GspL [Legionella sp.]
MSTCFIFFDAIDATPETDLPELLWAVRLDDTGDVDVALSAHTQDEIKAMQVGARTVVVLPSAVASIHLLDLPKLSMRKAREAIPYALEEALAEPVQDVHVAFERDESNSLHYRVVVLNKRRFKTWIQVLEALDLNFDAITLDWFALEPGEVCATEQDLLVREAPSADAVNGALSPSVAAEYIKAHPDKPGGVGTSKPGGVGDLAAGSYRLFFATRLLTRPFLNLCEGEFQRVTDSKGRLYWTFLCGGLLGALFLSVLGFNAFLLHQLHAREAVIDKEIKDIYYTFFPEATQVISPRFRIEQVLKTNTADTQSRFWFLLNQLSRCFSNHALVIEHIEFQDQMLSVRLVAKDFSVLEAFELQLKKQAVVVNQVEAVTRGNQVVSTLELQ